MTCRMTYIVEEDLPGHWQACIYCGLLITILRGYSRVDVTGRAHRLYPDAVEADTPPDMSVWLLITDTPRR